MKDREFLCWLHARLVNVYKENPTMDYIHKLRAIIYSMPPEQESFATLPVNNLDQLLVMLRKKDRGLHDLSQAH